MRRRRRQFSHHQIKQCNRRLLLLSSTARVYFLGFAILTAIVTAKSPLPVWRTLVAWLLFNLLPMLLLLAILNRKVRAVGPLVLVFLILVLAGPLIPILIALSDKRFL